MTDIIKVQDNISLKRKLFSELIKATIVKPDVQRGEIQEHIDDIFCYIEKYHKEAPKIFLGQKKKKFDNFK